MNGIKGLFALLALLPAATALAGTPPEEPLCPTGPDVAPPPDEMPWLEADRPVEERIELLVGEMLLEEKIEFITGDPCGAYGFYNAGIGRLQVPALRMADGPAGVRINNTDVNEGESTQLPAPIALAATWDRALADGYGDVLGSEARITGHNVLLGPTVDLVRDPRWGRNFETLGEDPLLQAHLGVAITRAIQRYPVMASAKHFHLYNQETERQTIDVQVDERALRELYSMPFEALVREAEIAAVMCSFNAVNGTPACENEYLLTELLRQAWGFEGFVLSDYGAVQSTVPTIMAGLDHEQPGRDHWGEDLLDAVRSGAVPEEVVDERVGNMLRPMFRLGLFEQPVPDEVVDFPEEEHGEFARLVAKRALVLLQNRDGLLPLERGSLDSIAVIGGDAATGIVEGGGSARVPPTYRVSLLDGIRDYAGEGISVEHAPGTDPLTPGHLIPGPQAIPSSVFTPPEGEEEEDGLLGEYWLEPDREGEPDFTRVDRQIAHALGFFNFPGFMASAVERLPDEFSTANFSARWTGTLTAPASGSYTFTLSSRGRAWLYLDDELVLDHGEPHELSSRSATVELEEGETRSIRVEYAAEHESIGEFVDIGGMVKLGWETPDDALAPGVQEAAALAAASDVAVVLVRTYESEAGDRPALGLPNGQDQLIREVVAANPRTIVVVGSGSPVAMPWIDEAPAVVQAWFPGQEHGNAIAELLFGAVDPSGRLPVTFPRSEEQMPTWGEERFPGEEGEVHFDEGRLIGYRWYDANEVEPLFPFGFGLSYTEFAYEGLEIETTSTAGGDEGPQVRVSFDVTNTGERRGAAVPQVYVGPIEGDEEAPPRRLAGFDRVELEPGETLRVPIFVDARSLRRWDPEADEWIYAQEPVALYVGESSRDIRLEGEIPGLGTSTQSASSADSGCGCGAASAGPTTALVGLAVLASRLGRRRRQPQA